MNQLIQLQILICLEKTKNVTKQQISE